MIQSLHFSDWKTEVPKAFSRITWQVSGRVWTQISFLSPGPHSQSFPQATCFTLSRSDSSLELGVEGWASEVVTEEDDFILGELVWFGAEMRLERGSASPASHSRGHTVFLPTNLANSTILGGGAPVLMAHLGKVVLFFSQGLRTDSGGQAINQKDQGQGMPCLNLSPQASSAPVQRTISGDYNPQYCLYRLSHQGVLYVRSGHPGTCSSCD